MLKYRSEFENYTPTPEASPCWKGRVCKHKEPTMGMCRFECEDYVKYQKLVDHKHEQSAIGLAIDAHKFTTMDKIQRRYR